MNELLDTFISRKAQEAEDAVLAALREELRTIARQERALLETQGVALQTMGKEVLGALASLRADISRLEARLQEQVKERTNVLQETQEGTAAAQRKILEAIYQQANDTRSLLAGLPAVLAAHERTLIQKQESLHTELDGLQRGLPAHFYRRSELREILDLKETEQRALMERSVREMQKQIRIAQIFGGLASLAGLLALVV